MYSFCVGFEKSQCIVQCMVCVGFAPQTIHIVMRGKSDECRVKCRVCV